MLVEPISFLLSSGPIPRIEDLAIPLISPVEVGPPDIIPGFLPRQGELVIAGETDVGKSLIALEVCSALVTGNPLWKGIQPTLMAKRILYVLGEHYDGVIQRLYQHTGLPMTDKVLLLGPEKLGADKWLVTNGKRNQIATDKFLKWCQGFDLVVFDPLSSFISGQDAENDNLQMRLLLDTMSYVTQSSGASCLVLAHLGKPSIGKDGQEHVRTKYAIRGASGIEDAATNIFYMSKVTGESDASKKVPDGRLFELFRRKYKGEAPPRYYLGRDQATLTHTLIEGGNPFEQVVSITRKAKIAELQACHPDMSFPDVLRTIATLEKCSVDSLKRDLGGKR